MLYLGLGSFAIILLLTWTFYKDDYEDFFKF
jgi:hypothetical protein